MSAAEPPADPKPPETADPRRGKAVVLYDGMCPLCQRGVRILKKLDWLKRLHYQDCRDTAHWPPSAVPLTLKELLAEMHVVTPDRKRAPSGYRAFRWMAWRARRARGAADGTGCPERRMAGLFEGPHPRN